MRENNQIVSTLSLINILFSISYGLGCKLVAKDKMLKKTDTLPILKH